MKNKKLMVALILMVTLLLLMVTCVKASDDVVQLPTIVTDNNPAGNTSVANEPVINTSGTNNVVSTPTATNNSTANSESLPQTGVNNTAVFVFIAICIVSAVYAYFRIRKYNDIH